MNYQFQYPQALYLLGFIPLFILLFISYQIWKRKAAIRIGDARLVKALYNSHSSTKSIIKFILINVAFILGCIALANPRKPDENSAGARKGIDIVIALDVSNSMLATDVSPTRLGKAKQFIQRLMENLPDDRVGLVVFAGNAYEQMPLTFDQQAAAMYVTLADPRQISIQGTSIGDALTKANLMFNGQSQRFHSVVLITDGETHDQNALQTAQELAKTGMMINTVGIGSGEGATISDSTGHPRSDATGQIIISKLNEQILQQIAAATNGKYVHLEGTEAAVKEILSQFSQIEKKALGDSSLYNYKTFYAWLTIPMLLLLLTELFFPDSKKIRV